MFISVAEMKSLLTFKNNFFKVYLCFKIDLLFPNFLGYIKQ